MHLALFLISMIASLMYGLFIIYVYCVINLSYYLLPSQHIFFLLYTFVILFVYHIVICNFKVHFFYYVYFLYIFVIILSIPIFISLNHKIYQYLISKSHPTLAAFDFIMK